MKLFIYNLFLLSLLISNAFAQKSEKPNVLLIYCDDLGPGVLGSYGQKLIATPNIDKLAKEGMLFTSAYGSNVCSPARASMLTGLHNGHAPRHTPGGLQNELSIGAIDQTTFDKKVTIKSNQGHYYIGQMAQSAGYSTAYIGKLGFGYSDTKEMIDSYGFDYHVGLYDAVMCWSFYPPYYRLNGETIPLPNNPKLTKREPNCPLVGEENMTYVEDVWVEHALKYMEEKKDEPFFMIYATQLPHGPASIAPKDFKYKGHEGWTKKEQVFASMIYKLDQSVGKLLDKLDELNLSDNTVVIFTGDNGHEPQSYVNMNPNAKDPDIVYDYSSNTFDQSKVKKEKKKEYWNGHHQGEDIFEGTQGRRGIKRHNHEGGINIPYIAKWPNHIKSGKESDFIITDYDIMPTVADLMGIDLEVTDGISYLPTLLGKGKQKSHDFIFFKCTTGVSQDVIIKDGWKLINERDVEKSDFETQQKVYKWALYHLDKDPYEKKDLAAKYPEKVKELKALIQQQNQPLSRAN
ncbi:sulfatase-like hydrolase/transferase [Flammeovirga sp. SubArs3]|uniref:sulfatase-like hydrolase/transferase n=1 Tax=Flammeovirga sp. SubArs3 TaxID=2995316 RepID=UPI00248C43AE|nr:sulfatase-like hydrolase/transferase [Flammeovirga sp. SubArs3]